MKAETQFQLSGFNAEFSRFAELIGESTWRRAVDNAKNEIRGNKYLKSYLLEKYKVSFALQSISSEIRRNGFLRPELFQDDGIYDAASLVIRFVKLHDALDRRRAESWKRRLQDCLQKNASDLKALVFELQVATVLSSKDFELDFPQLEGKSNVDIEAEKSGAALSVECKYISSDKGVSVKTRDALDLYRLIEKETAELISKRSSGLLVRILFKGKMPSRYEEKKAISVHVRRALVGNVLDDTSVSIQAIEIDRDFSCVNKFYADENAFRQFLLGFGIVNKNAICIGDPKSRGYVIFSIESSRKDDLLDQMFRTIADAAVDQIPPGGVGVLCVKFESLSSSDLETVAKKENDPTALRIAVSNFLSSEKAKNVARLVFFADGEIKGHGENSFSKEGAAYGFDGPCMHGLPDELLKSLFSSH